MLISVSQHIQYYSCSFYAANNSVFLTFPTFFAEIDSSKELTVHVASPTNMAMPLSFDKTTAPLSPQVSPLPSKTTTKSTPRNHLCRINERGDFIQIDKTGGPLKVRARRVQIPFPNPLEPPLQDPATSATSPSAPISVPAKSTSHQYPPTSDNSNLDTPSQKHTANLEPRTACDNPLVSPLVLIPHPNLSPAVQGLDTAVTEMDTAVTENPTDQYQVKTTVQKSSKRLILTCSFS